MNSSEFIVADDPDLTLVVGDRSRRVRIHVSVTILSNASTRFKKMLCRTIAPCRSFQRPRERQHLTFNEETPKVVFLLCQILHDNAELPDHPDVHNAELKHALRALLLAKEYDCTRAVRPVMEVMLDRKARRKASVKREKQNQVGLQNAYLAAIAAELAYPSYSSICTRRLALDSTSQDLKSCANSKTLPTLALG
jgi:hypothetical protein